MGKRKSEWPASNQEMWPLAKIIPYENNPRTHPPEQVVLLAKSMIDDGVTMPILVDEKGVIIAGHGRLLAALMNKFEKYPVVIARGWNEEQKRAARVRDNQLALLSGWDTQLIRGEIMNLKAEGYDLALLGFPETTLRAWGISVGTEGVQDPEVAPERPKNPASRLGDVWVLGDHRLVCGDSTSESDVSLCMGDRCPHLTVTDPPYGVDYDPAWRADANKWKGSLVKLGARAMGRVKNDTQADWSETWKLCRSDVIYSWSSSLHAIETAIGLRAAGFVLRNQIVWDKLRIVIGRGDYHWQHEPCWYAVRKGKTAHWNGGRTQTTVWSIPKPQTSETGHGTQKPIECMKRPIENNSRKGDHVYDPFLGSGTTLIAAEMTGRRCLGLELDPGYCDVIVERWEKFTGKAATLGADGPTFASVRKARAKGRPIGKTAPAARAKGKGRPKPPPAAKPPVPADQAAE